MRVHSPKLGFVVVLGCSLAGCAYDHLVDPSRETPRPVRNTVQTGTSSSADTETGATPRALFEDQAKRARPEKLEPFVEEGTGRLIGQPASLGEDALVFDDAGDITLNVVDADIREVVRLILEDGLNANYVIDPTVAGSTTIRTSRPVPAMEILPLLSSVLQTNGASLVEKDGLFQILPMERASVAGGQPSTRLSLRSGRPGSGILLAPLRYADSLKLEELLQPFVANQGSVQANPDRNTLLIDGSPDQIATMSDLIDMFDVDWMAGMSFGFYPLERAAASDLAFELDQIFGTGEEGGSPDQPTRFLPIERLSAVLVIAKDPALLRRAQSWIGRLDKIGEGDEEQIYVYPVQNGRAADLAAVLGELFDIRSSVIGPDPLLAPGLEAAELQSSLLDDDEEQDGAGDRRSSSRERGPARRRGSDRSFSPFFPLSPFDPRGLTEGSGDLGTKIVADEGNNSLLIKAPPKDYRKIEAALRELDRPPLQVLLEATIAEVTLTDKLRYGVQWFFDTGNTDLVLSSRKDGSVDPFFPGFSGILSSSDVDVVIDALDSVTDINIVSSPQILVLDNQTALLEVGDEVPVVTRQAEGTDADDRLVTTIEQRQTGVILNVTPRVNASGLVVLDIQQEVSDVNRTVTSGIDSPTISQRRVGTTVAVDSNQTVALGGLIEEEVELVRNGIPILMDIPYLGWLFGRTTDDTERTELLILLTPKVLPNTRAAVAATDELRQRLRAAASLADDVSIPRVETVAADAAAVPGPRYMIQLTSLPTEAQAEAAWQDYKQQYADLIDDLPNRIRHSTPEGRNTFGVQVGPIASFERADGICNRVKARGGDCLVLEGRDSVDSGL